MVATTKLKTQRIKQQAQARKDRAANALKRSRAKLASTQAKARARKGK